MVLDGRTHLIFKYFFNFWTLLATLLDSSSSNMCLYKYIVLENTTPAMSSVVFKRTIIIEFHKFKLAMYMDRSYVKRSPR